MKNLHDSKQKNGQLVVRCGLRAGAGECQPNGKIPEMKCEYICGDDGGIYREGIRCTEADTGRYWDEVVSRIFVD